MDCNAGLTLIPDDLSALSKLELLRLDSCKGIKHIPSCLAPLKSLRELSLDDTTGLSYVDSIKNLKLDKLSLRFDHLSSGLVVFHFPCLPLSLPFPVFQIPASPCNLSFPCLSFAKLVSQWC